MEKKTYQQLLDLAKLKMGIDDYCNFEEDLLSAACRRQKKEGLAFEEALESVANDFWMRADIPF